MRQSGTHGVPLRYLGLTTQMLPNTSPMGIPEIWKVAMQVVQIDGLVGPSSHGSGNGRTILSSSPVNTIFVKSVDLSSGTYPAFVNHPVERTDCFFDWDYRCTVQGKSDPSSRPRASLTCVIRYVRKDYIDVVELQSI